MSESVISKRILKVTSILAVSTLGIVFNTIPVWAYINRTGAPYGTAGTILADAQISGGLDFYISTTSEPDLESYIGYNNTFRYGSDGLPINNGNDTDGGIWGFDHTSENGVPIIANNGYKMVGVSTIDEWISALKGDPSYVHENLWNTTFIDSTGQTFDVSNISQIVEESGAAFVPSGNFYNQPVYATDPPRASIGIAGSTSVRQGDPLKFYNHAYIEAYHSTWHFEYIRVTNAQGQDVTSQVFRENSLQGSAPYNGEILYAGNGAQMVEVAGGGTTSFPPQFVETVNGSSSQPNVIDTTNLKPGRYIITLYVKDWFNRAANATSTTFQVTPGNNQGGGGNGGGSGGNPGEPSGGGGTACPPPTVPQKPADQVLSYYWSPDGSGGQNLTWTDTHWVLQQRNDANGCVMYQWVDQPKTYTHDYPLFVSNFAVTGLFYDPGKPGDLWSATNTLATQRNEDQFFDGSTVDNNPALPTYGNPNGSPAVYVRVGGGFSFRVMWTGSPHDMPSGGNVTYRLINPSGESRTWTKTFSLLPQTIFNNGDVPVWDPNGNGYPPPATEYGWGYASVPKYASQGTPNSYADLTSWNLTGDPGTAAHMDVRATFLTVSGSSVTWRDPDLAQALGYPTWYFVHEIQ